MSEPSASAGKIVTFYSYKGGTGRSMALANVAWLLANSGAKVLVIDWDLEAPGLHRYFHPFIEDKDLTETPGVIDYFVDVETASRRAGELARAGEGGQARWFEPYTVLLRYSRSLDFDFPGEGMLDFVCAGRQDESYGERVTSFDWRGFYQDVRGGVVLEALKAKLRAQYDSVLIDSRTGVSDTSGICTVQMPDDLVVMFTLNRQSIRGASAAAHSAFEQRRKPDGSPGMRVLPVRTRVERVEAERLRAAKATAAAAFDDLLVHLSEPERASYWGSIEVPYQPFYAHEEVLAPFADGEPESGSMLSAMFALAHQLVGGQNLESPRLDQSTRKEWLGRFIPVLAKASARGPVVSPNIELGASGVVFEPEAVVSSPAAAPAGVDVVVSYSMRDSDSYLGRFLDELKVAADQAVGRELRFAIDHGLEPGSDWKTEWLEALRTCRAGVALLSPHYYASEWCTKELEVLRRRIRDEKSKALIAIPLFPTVELPQGALALAPDAALSERGLAGILRGSRRPRELVVHRLAQAIRAALSHPLRAMSSAELTSTLDFSAIPKGSMDAVAKALVFYAGEPTRVGPMWTPFVGSTTIGHLVTAAAASEHVVCDVRRFETLVSMLEAHEHLVTPFVIIVDGESTQALQTLTKLWQSFVPSSTTAVLAVGASSDLRQLAWTLGRQFHGPALEQSHLEHLLARIFAEVRLNALPKTLA